MKEDDVLGVFHKPYGGEVTPSDRTIAVSA